MSAAQRRTLTALAIFSCISLFLTSGESDPVDRYNVVWNTPGADSSDSMPVGNGEVGLNVWTEPDALLLYIARTDAWSENCRLLKLGRVRITLDPNPFAAEDFRQELVLRNGEIEVAAGGVSVSVWVDAHRPVVMVEVSSPEPITARAQLQLWRTEKRQITGREMFSAYGMNGAPHAVFVHPDTVVPGEGDRVVWYHRNGESIWRETMGLQGMATWAGDHEDPLLHRTFGGTISGPGMVADGDTVLISASPAREHLIQVVTHTAQTDTPEEWLAQLREVEHAADATALQERRAAHEEWWRSFWERSWLRVTGPSLDAAITTNDLPLRIGADSDGHNQFMGLIGRARVWNRGLSAEEISSLAADRDAQPTDTAGLLGDWDLGQAQDGAIASRSGSLAANIVGELQMDEAEGALRFGAGGWVEIADAPELDLTRAVTMDAWVRPDQHPQRGGRIIDKSRAGTSNGYLLDTYPGNSVRMILEPNTLTHDAKLRPGEWAHVAATFDSATGEQRLYVNGALVAATRLSVGPEQISQGYALQRFISACAGRGSFPIKFNGSLFTVDAVDDGQSLDADYRRWGGPYWFQNTRLAYWPMLASGDWEMMLPLFGMYMDALPFAKARTQTYFSHDGAFFPETMFFFGAYANENYGWNRTGKQPGDVDNTYIRYYFSGALELIALMLENYAYTGDADFARQTLAPFAEEIIRFYDSHYGPGRDGKRRFEPAQSLETWQKAIDPLPPIAGLRYVLPRLIAMPRGVAREDTVAAWKALLSELPDLPMAGEGEERVLAPAGEILEQARNSENPELYAVYPYRLYGVGKPELEVAVRTFGKRRVKGHRGWQQDDTQAAFLGLADVAAEYVSGRFAEKHLGSRFPAFWGPNFDWIPDQDHGTNGLMALQTMLLQCEGDRMILFPAWPRDWDVEFRLHAPQSTTIEGVYRSGRLESLRVEPEVRRADLDVREPR